MNKPNRLRTQKRVILNGAKTGGYKATPHIWYQQPRDLPAFSFATIRAMLIDPGIRLNLATRAAPITGAQFAFKTADDTWQDGMQCSDPVIGEFIYRQLMHIWRNFLPAILRAQVWGWSAGEVTYKLGSSGLVEIDKLEPRHAADCRLLKLSHNRWGVAVDRVEGAGVVKLKFPTSWFHAYNAEDGEDYGVPILLGAYSPWADKWFNGGALDVRRLFMHKDAYGGADLGFPEGSTWVDGVTEPVPNKDVARQIVEQITAGGVTTRPSDRDEHGNEKWPLTRAVVASNPQHILQYPRDLDDEIKWGMEISDDVTGEGSSGAWAGKRVTMAAFYASLDHWIVQIIADLSEQIFNPLCELNFDKVPDYEIRHKPLAEQAMEQQSNAGPGGDDQAGGMPEMPGGGDDPFGGQHGSPGIAPEEPTQPPLQLPGQPKPIGMSLLEKISRGEVNAWKAITATRMALGIAEEEDEPEDTAGEEFAFNDERIAAMAELLASIYGDKAEEMLDKVLGEPKKLSAWSPDDHPRGPDGRFITKGSPEAYKAARNMVDDAHRTRSPESMRSLMDHMNTLSIKQLHQLKRDYGTKGSAATKAALIEKLSGRLVSGRHRLARKANDTPVAPVREEVYSVPTSSLKIDPKRFQYKVKGIGDKGVGKELKGTNVWNPELGGVLLVWRDPETDTDYVVNGHHRHELAARTGTGEVNVRYIDAPDAKQARATGALANIAEGRGTALDAAKYLRDSDRDIDHLRDAGVSMSGAIASDAVELTKLSDKAFQAVTNGIIEEPKAVAVAKFLPDHKLQDKLFKKLQDREEDGKDWTIREIEQAAKKMARAGKVTQQGTDLFGDFESEESTFDQEVEIESYISKQLSQEANDFGAVANTRRAERVSEAGNTLAVEENERRRDTAREHAADFERESGLRGEVSTAIREFAAELSKAKNRKTRDTIKREAYGTVRELLSGSAEKPTPARDENLTDNDIYGALAMSVVKQWGDKPGEFHLSDEEAEQVEESVRKLFKMASKPAAKDDDDAEPDAYADMTWDSGEVRMALDEYGHEHAADGKFTSKGGGSSLKAEPHRVDPLPISPPKEGWTLDPGAMPGEPSHFLGESDNARAIISEIETEDGDAVWEAAIIRNGETAETKQFSGLEEAADWAEKNAPDELDQAEELEGVPGEQMGLFDEDPDGQLKLFNTMKGKRKKPPKFLEDFKPDETWKEIKESVKSEKGQAMLFGLLRMARDAAGHEHKGKGPGGGQFTKGSGGGGGPQPGEKPGKQSAKPEQKPSKPQAAGNKPSKEVPGTDVDDESTTAPPPGKAYTVDVEETDGQGIAKAARVGVPGSVVPPPPSVPQLPNLTKHEREVESRFRDAFMKDPNGMANEYRKLIAATDKPYTFETDQGKMLSNDWKDDDLETQMKKRQCNNNALHATANAIVKRAFLMHLDTLKAGDNVLVTVGGCGSGKGYTLKNTDLGKGLTAEAKAVWDSAGDQNATENPWILAEAEKRGLKVTYAYVAGDPKVAWSDPGRGVVTRAHNKGDGRMVDAAVFADSYVMGAKNHHAFYNANKQNQNAKFLFFDATNQQPINGIPPESLKMDRKSLYHWAMGSIQSRSDVAPSVLRGATQGARIWNEELA